MKSILEAAIERWLASESEQGRAICIDKPVLDKAVTTYYNAQPDERSAAISFMRETLPENCNVARLYSFIDEARRTGTQK